MKVLAKMDSKTWLLAALLSMAGSALAVDCFWLQIGSNCGYQSTPSKPSCPDCETMTFTPDKNTYCVQTEYSGLTQWNQTTVQQTVDIVWYYKNTDANGKCTSCGPKQSELTGNSPYQCDQCTLSGDVCFGGS